MSPKLIAAYAQHHSLTPAAAEAEIIATLQDKALMAAGRVRPFAYLSKEDLAGHAVLLGLEALPKYDVTRPLGSFLYTHMRNRLHNLKRAIFFRAQAPCSCCDAFNPPAEPCEKWKGWNRINATRSGLGQSGPASDEPIDRPDVEGNFDLPLVAEIESFVEASFPQALRSDYYRLKGGVTLPALRREAVREAILARFGGGDASE